MAEAAAPAAIVRRCLDILRGRGLVSPATVASGSTTAVAGMVLVVVAELVIERI